MATFNIEGLLTIYGELELTPENGHTSTDWEAYVDGVKVTDSMNDSINLVSWTTALIGNDGKPYDGTNGMVSGRVRIHVDNYVSDYFYLVCKPRLSVANSRLPYLMKFNVTSPTINIIKYSKTPYLYTGTNRIITLEATVSRPTVTITRLKSTIRNK